MTPPVDDAAGVEVVVLELVEATDADERDLTGEADRDVEPRREGQNVVRELVVERQRAASARAFGPVSARTVTPASVANSWIR
jgi:hypothetical protein